MSIREYPFYTFEVAESGVESIQWASALTEQFGAPSDVEYLRNGLPGEVGQDSRVRLTLRRFGLIGVVFGEREARATVETIIPDSLAAQAEGLIAPGSILVVRSQSGLLIENVSLKIQHHCE